MADPNVKPGEWVWCDGTVTNDDLALAWSVIENAIALGGTIAFLDCDKKVKYGRVVSVSRRGPMADLHIRECSKPLWAKEDFEQLAALASECAR